MLANTHGEMGFPQGIYIYILLAYTLEFFQFFFYNTKHMHSIFNLSLTQLWVRALSTTHADDVTLNPVKQICYYT